MKKFRIVNGQLRTVKRANKTKPKIYKQVHRTNPDMWSEIAKEANKRVSQLEVFKGQELEHFTRETVKEYLGEEIQFIGTNYKNRKEFREYWSDKLMRDQGEDGYEIWSDKQVNNFMAASKVNYPGLDLDARRMKYDKNYRDDKISDILVYCDNLGITLAQFLGSL